MVKKVQHPAYPDLQKYLFKETTTEELMNQLGLIIQSEIEEYLNYVPEEIVNNFSKELKNKIQDKLFEINLNLPENFKKEKK